MDPAVELSRAARRLKSELVDDGIVLELEPRLLAIVLDEVGYARRPPRFERRIPLYGSMIVPDDRSLVSAGELADLIPLDGTPLPMARRFADGRSSYLAINADGSRRLAAFRRSVQYEADLVEIQADTGVLIVQRTPVHEATRLFTATATIEWSGYRWTARPNARAQQDLLQPYLPHVAEPVLTGMLELALHWLSPGRVGATVVMPGPDDASGLDIENGIVAPALSVTARHHYPALFAALMQTDLAAVIDSRGQVLHLGVGLNSSAEADAAVGTTRGMRHRSAARYTYDHHDAVAVVVSEDGPVTVFHQGRPLTSCRALGADLPAVAVG